MKDESTPRICPRCQKPTIGLLVIGRLSVCEDCYLEFTGSFFPHKPHNQVRQCPRGHEVPFDDSPRVGWITCPTCLASAPEMPIDNRPIRKPQSLDVDGDGLLNVTSESSPINPIQNKRPDSQPVRNREQTDYSDLPIFAQTPLTMPLPPTSAF